MSTFSPGYLYAMHRTLDNAVKIGHSADPIKRRRQLACQSLGNGDVSIVNYCPVSSMRDAESEAHKIIAHKRVNGEWFNLALLEAIDLIWQFVDESTTLPFDAVEDLY